MWLTIGEILDAVQDNDGEIDRIEIKLDVLDEGTNIKQMTFSGVRFDQEAKKLFIQLETIK
jgi:hypothetical protein